MTSISCIQLSTEQALTVRDTTTSVCSKVVKTLSATLYDPKTVEPVRSVSSPANESNNNKDNTTDLSVSVSGELI